MSESSSRNINRRDALRTMAAASLAVSTQATAQESSPMANPQPNVLLIHCHDLGQYLHCYDVPTVRTPNLDALAADGVRFANSFCTAPQCSPSRSSLFTGRYPHNTGVMGLCHGEFAWDLHPEERHLGQHLSDAGYRAGCVGVLHETRSGAKRCGFETHTRRGRATLATDAAIEDLRRFSQEGGKPFYLQVGFIEPHRLRGQKRFDDLGFVDRTVKADSEHGVHLPGYLRDTEGTRTELAELQGAVRHVDAQVGRMLEALTEFGLEDDTLVIFTTDHGVAMPRSKCSLYDPGIEVALIVRLLGRDGWHGGKTVQEMIQNIDVVPSILDLVGAPVPNNLAGESFKSLLEGGDYTPREELFAEITYHDYYDPRRCIRTKTHKLIVNFTNSYGFMDPSQSWRPRSDTNVPQNHALDYHPVAELYDLESDPWEQQDLAGDEAHAETLRDLLNRLQAHLEATEDPILQGAVTSPMHRKALAALRG